MKKKATITDRSGINITGETGHEIELVIDGELFKEVEKIRARAVSALCTYEIRAAYVRIHATELKAVCDALLSQMLNPQLEMDL